MNKRDNSGIASAALTAAVVIGIFVAWWVIAPAIQEFFTRVVAGAAAR